MKRKMSLQTQLTLILAAGFAAGTFFANFSGRSYIGELGIFSESYRQALVEPAPAGKRLFVYLLLQRLAPAAALMALMYTRWRAHALLFLAAWGTFSLGVFWSSCILVCGIRGAALFFLALIPHGICYGWSWLRLGRASLERSTRLNWLPGTLLMFVMGAAAETWLHPIILRIALEAFGTW